MKLESSLLSFLDLVHNHSFPLGSDIIISYSDHPFFFPATFSLLKYADIPPQLLCLIVDKGPNYQLSQIKVILS